MAQYMEPLEYAVAWKVLEELKKDATGFGTPVMQALNHISLIQKHLITKMNISKVKRLYIRFGDVPTNERSKIYRGEEEIGIENGVSVYPAYYDANGNITLGLSLPITPTSLHTQQHLLEYDDRPCYLVTGDYIGKGTDGEPLIRNIEILKEIKRKELWKNIY